MCFKHLQHQGYGSNCICFHKYCFMSQSTGKAQHITDVRFITSPVQSKKPLIASNSQSPTGIWSYLQCLHHLALKRRLIVPYKAFERGLHVILHHLRGFTTHWDQVLFSQNQIYLCKALFKLLIKTTHTKRHPLGLKLWLKPHWWTFHLQKEGRGVHLFVCMMGRWRITTELCVLIHTK